MRLVTLSLASLVLIASAAFADAKKTKYLVIAPHTAEQCLAALDDIEQHDQALLKKIDWGCAAGDHTGYLEVNAADEASALKTLPVKTRTGARAVKLVKFSPEEIRSFHAAK